MLHRVTCPTCQDKFTVRESSMGQRQICPNCQTQFLAGKSPAEDEAPISMKLQTSAAAINKTMLGETAPPIRFNCPRCKKPLEAPSIEGGTKKPCPACGQRLQIPAAPKSAPQPQPNLNKTMLAAEEGAARPSTTTRAPLSRYAMAGIAGSGFLFVGLLACVIVMIFSGGAERKKFLKAQQDFANAQKELADLKKSIQEKETLMAHHRQIEMEQQKNWDRLMDEHRARQRELYRQREDDKKISEVDLAAKLREKRRQEEDELKRQERDRQIDRAKFELEMKTKLETLKAQLDAANQKAQQATVIISQPPPYYPPYHPRYYWGW